MKKETVLLIRTISTVERTSFLTNIGNVYIISDVTVEISEAVQMFWIHIVQNMGAYIIIVIDYFDVKNTRFIICPFSLFDALKIYFFNFF